MRICIIFLAAFSLLGARSSNAQVEVVVPEAGRMKTTAKVENGILGVANSFTRPRGSARECVGACFYATTTKTKLGCAVIRIATLIAPAANLSAAASAGRNPVRVTAPLSAEFR